MQTWAGAARTGTRSACQRLADTRTVRLQVRSRSNAARRCGDDAPRSSSLRLYSSSMVAQRHDLGSTPLSPKEPSPSRKNGGQSRDSKLTEHT